MPVDNDRHDNMRSRSKESIHRYGLGAVVCLHKLIITKLYILRAWAILESSLDDDLDQVEAVLSWDWEFDSQRILDFEGFLKPCPSGIGGLGGRLEFKKDNIDLLGHHAVILRLDRHLELLHVFELTRQLTLRQ